MLRVSLLVRWVVLGLLLTAGPAAAEPAGRALLAIGEVVLVRDGQESPLKSGAEILSGDTIRTGDAGRAQLRLTDNSLISLRPLTEFRIDEYRYAGKQDGTEAAFFSLVRGGLRTIAGLVGSVNRERYAMKIPTATIGRRGSEYAVVDCRGTCRNADGSKADDGSYGSVARGGVNATNDAGEVPFDAGQAFYIKDFGTLAKLIPEAPSFLSESAGRGQPVLPPAAPPPPGGFRSGDQIHPLPDTPVYHPPSNF